jgi:serine/threonine protein kinase
VNNPSSDPKELEQQIQQALREYLERVDRGETIEREEFISRYPQIAEELRSYIATSEDIRQMAAQHTDRRGPREATDVTTRSISHQAEDTVPPPGRSTGQQEQQGAELSGQFGRYRVIKPLGRGAMGTVYLAEDTHLQRQVAIKTPHFDGDDADELLQRFHREARASGTLRHPNICPVYDVGEIDGQHYISMAYIEGKLLSAYIRPNSPQTERNVLLLIHKLALALVEAHNHGIVHRDLKPGNVMIDGRGEPIIMDFGLAHQTQSESQVRLTQSGMLIGSPAYMSPEQVEGDLERIGPASDQYSLGVIFYELLTGQLPFQGSLAAVLGQIVVKQPPSPAALRHGLDPRIEAICLRMMAKRSENRFGSLSEVADELLRVLKTPNAKPSRKEALLTSGDPATNAATTAETTPVTESNIASLAAVARKLLTRHDYEQVVQMLEQVPVEQRNDEIRQLLDKARSLADEVAFLLVEIEEATRQRDDKTAFDRAEKLLRLKPAHSRAKQVREQCRRRRSRGKRRSAVDRHPFTERFFDRKSWVPWAAIAFGFLVFGGMYGVVVMYLRVGDAVVKVQINNPEIKVGLQGRTLTIQSAQEPVKVDAGEGNTLTITYGELEFTTDRFTLNSGNNPAVVVELLDAKLAARFGEDPIGEWPVPSKPGASESVAARSAVSGTSSTAVLEQRATSKTSTVTLPRDSQSVNLLALIDPARDGKNGEWIFDGDSLVTPSVRQAVLEIPFEPPEEYELTAVVERKSGDNGLHIGLVAANSQTIMAIDVGDFDRGTKGSGLHTLDGKSFEANETYRKVDRLVLREGTTHTIVCNVRKQHLEVTCDGESLVDWRGDFRRLSAGDFLGKRTPGRLFLGDWESVFHISKLVLKPLDPGNQAVAEWIDIIPLIDPQRDKYDIPGWTGTNQWQVRKSELRIAAGPKSAKLLFPLILDGPSLEWEMDFTRIAGDRGFNTDIPANTGIVPLMFNDETGGLEFHPKSGLNVSAGIRTGKRSTIRVRVEQRNNQDFLEVFVDGTSVGSWTGSRDEIAKPPVEGENYSHATRNGLWVRPNGEYVFHRIRLRMLEGEASPVSGQSLPEQEWTELFNGKDLTGWKEIPSAGFWTVRKGVIAGTDRTGWLGTEREYSDFELELEYKLEPEAHSGVFLRAFDDGAPSGRDFVEIQLLDDAAPEYRAVKAWQKNGSVYGIIPAAQSVAAPANKWNKLLVKAEGPWITVAVNGTQVLHGSLEAHKPLPLVKPDVNRRSGRIGLQIYGRPVEFKNIRIRELINSTSAGIMSSKRLESSPPPAEVLTSSDWHWVGPIDFSNNTTEAGNLLTVIVDQGEAGDRGLWSYDRSSDTDRWKEPTKLNESINGSGDDASPFLSVDRLTLIFESDRPGGQGMTDLWMSTRATVNDDWSEPVNLGPEVNSPNTEGLSTLSTDGLTLIFASDRDGGRGSADLWMSQRSALDAPWTAAVNVGDRINSPHRELAPILSSDGRVLLFASDRPGGLGTVDVWMSERASAEKAWTVPINLGSPVNGKAWDYNTVLSADGTALLLGSRMFRRVRTKDSNSNGRGTEAANTAASVNLPHKPQDIGEQIKEIQALIDSKKAAGDFGKPANPKKMEAFAQAEVARRKQAGLIPKGAGIQFKFTANGSSVKVQSLFGGQGGGGGRGEGKGFGGGRGKGFGGGGGKGFGGGGGKGFGGGGGKGSGK